MIHSTIIPVTVIIPCFRCAATIERAVQSIVEQTQRPTEVILVDDASGDNTLPVLQQLESQYKGWIKIIVLGENCGASRARNAGWDAATQPYIAFLDADDSWHPAKLAIQYQVMLNNPSIVASGHRCLWLCNQQLLPDIPDLINLSPVNPLALLFKNRFGAPTSMLKRELAFRFVDNKRYSEDCYLWQQIAFSGFLLVFIDSSLTYTHKPLYGASGLSAQLWAMEKGELDNFFSLYQDKKINYGLFLLASAFSLLKYCKRVITTKMRRVG
ncbi:MAG: glycosyltransferase family 2 protein [Methylobacter sp.]|nr:glycosyltransferase family 2 protein [Methylobacter sp.]MDP2428739.1 glycosyltransferase family 2 protein [Methylobacter sp.]MDP3053245.1 glycosyltransferase family 2 protein [Methylobacter sp.]MDP3361556.1 glycosyltransferase family 2 protein [Methylobacter sp.]MDZ4219396.1 glycosyltransferase family 2 protein [Methylobacter sp.]